MNVSFLYEMIGGLAVLSMQATILCGFFYTQELQKQTLEKKPNRPKVTKKVAQKRYRTGATFVPSSSKSRSPRERSGHQRLAN